MLLGGVAGAAGRDDGGRPGGRGERRGRAHRVQARHGLRGGGHCQPGRGQKLSLTRIIERTNKDGCSAQSHVLCGNLPREIIMCHSLLLSLIVIS